MLEAILCPFDKHAADKVDEDINQNGFIYLFILKKYIIRSRMGFNFQKGSCEYSTLLIYWIPVGVIIVI